MAATKHNTKTESELGNSRRKADHKIKFRERYLPLIFIFIYLIVGLLYLILARSGYNILTGWGSKLIAFSTSPFNLLEDFSGGYKSAQVGYFWNAVYLLPVLYIAIFYYHLVAETKLVSFELVFWGSIASSYIVSITIWAIGGWPSTGTSIIGFSILCYLFVLSVFDFPKIHKNKQENRLKFARIYVTIFVASFSFVLLLFGYLLGNSSYSIHLAGGAVCALLIFAMFRRRQAIARRAELKAKKTTLITKYPFLNCQKL